MKFTTSVLALVLFGLVPETISGWMLAPRFFDTYDPFQLATLSPRRLLREQQGLIQQMGFKHSSPRFEIESDENEFKVSVELPAELKSEDVNVTFEKDKSMLTISGARGESSDTYSYKSTFSQSFYLDPTVDKEKIQADLKEGLLTVSAPRDMKKLEEFRVKVPITESKVTASSPEPEVAKAEAALVE